MSELQVVDIKWSEPSFDVIVSEPGFNKSSLRGWAIPASLLGSFLASIMRVRVNSFDTDDHVANGLRSNVTVHMHPTFWEARGVYHWVHDCRCGDYGPNPQGTLTYADYEKAGGFDGLVSRSETIASIPDVVQPKKED